MIILGLWAKYDIDGLYFRFSVQILVNPEKKCRIQLVPIFTHMSINISVVFISELVGCMLLIRYGVFLIIRKGFTRLWEKIHQTLGEDL